MSEEYEKPLIIPEGGDADPTGLAVPFLVAPAVAFSAVAVLAAMALAVSGVLAEVIVAEQTVYSPDSE